MHRVDPWFQEQPPSPELLPPSFPSLTLRAAPPQQLLHPSFNRGPNQQGYRECQIPSDPEKLRSQWSNIARKFSSVFTERGNLIQKASGMRQSVFAQPFMGRNSPFIVSISGAAIHLGNAKIHLEAALICCTQLFEQ